MIRIKQDSQYISYILEDSYKFHLTGYRVLQKQGEKGLIPCSRDRYNGHIKLLYPVANYVPVSTIAVRWSSGLMFECILRIIKILTIVQENGFLQLETVDLDLSHIFIEADNGQVHMIVLPVTSDGKTLSLESWENRLKKMLLEILGISHQAGNAQRVALRGILREHIDSLDSLNRKIKQIAFAGGMQTDSGKRGKTDRMAGNNEVHFVSENPENKIDIVIRKKDFILGKNISIVDAVVNVSPAISRKHCAIHIAETKVYIEDLGSKNHTYVNGMLVQPGQQVEIRPGDKIRLADEEFRIEYR